VSIRSIQGNVRTCQSSNFSIMRKTQSVIVCQFTVTAVHIDTSSLTSKHSALQWCPSTVSLTSSDVTTDTENVFSDDAGAERKSSAIAYKLETGILIFVTQSNIPWLYMWQEFNADMTDIPQAHWQLGGNVGRGNCRQAFSYMFEGFSGTRYGGSASSAIQQP